MIQARHWPICQLQALIRTIRRKRVALAMQMQTTTSLRRSTYTNTNKISWIRPDRMNVYLELKYLIIILILYFFFAYNL